MIRVQRVTTRQAFEDLRDVWDDLLSRANRGLPFLSHDWFRCCLHAYAGPDLQILVAWEGSRAIAIAPLWRYESPHRGLNLRRIGFITCADTPAVDFIVEPDRTEEALGAIVTELRATRRPAWDCLTLNQWPADSPCLHAMRSLLRTARIPYFVARSSLVPRLRIRGTWEEYWRTRPALFRKSRRGIVNRMTRAGTVRAHCVRLDETGEAFQAVLRISRRSWKEARGLALTSRPATTEFFRCLTDVAGRRGWLFLWLLELDGEAVAMEYDLHHDGAVYALRADIDETYKQHSPGAYLEYHLVKHLFDGGFVEYNTGPGENPYKLRWADHISENLSLNVSSGTWRGAAAHAMEVLLVPSWRRLRAWVPAGGASDRGSADAT